MRSFVFECSYNSVRTIFLRLAFARLTDCAEKQAAGATPSVNAETRDTLQELRQRLDDGSVSVLPPSLRSQENAVRLIPVPMFSVCLQLDSILTTTY